VKIKKDIFRDLEYIPMNVGILTRWNATCGVSLHAELLAEEFFKMGHDVRVFAPYTSSANRWWHHRIIRDDEDFVIRCYNELNPDTMAGGSLECEKVLSEDLDLLIVESYTSIPYSDVEKLVEKVDAVTVAVIHEGAREDIRYCDMGVFDAIVAFDERYVREILYDCVNKVRIIPYPCYPVRKGNRKFAEDCLTFFSFGRQPYAEYSDFISALEKLRRKYDFVYRVVRSDGLLPFDMEWLKQERRRLRNTEEVYRCLHSSDIHLLPKGNTNNVVVSSTFYQCLGSLVPIVALNTRHFELLPDEKPAVIYRDLNDLTKKLEMLIEDDEFRKGIIKAARKFVEEFRSDRIAGRFIELYRSLSETRAALNIRQT
jgi:glycosyltransferase involved in cell wall biosynthesis